MNPLYLPTDIVRQPIHDNFYDNLTINRNGQQIVNSNNVRLVIYPAQPINNQLLASITVRDMNIQNQNHPIQRNQPIRRTRSV